MAMLRYFPRVHWSFCLRATFIHAVRYVSHGLYVKNRYFCCAGCNVLLTRVYGLHRLSITHKVSTDGGPQFDISETGQASPHD